MSKLNVKNRTMFIQDNITVLDNLNSECVDLIYLDPPFNSNRHYSAPVGSKAAGASFKDAWTLDDIDDAWIDVIAADNAPLAELIGGIGKVNGKGDMSYLIFMARRLLEMHRILKKTGSIYLHCDPTMSHSLKLLLDCIFGKRNFRNEIVWCYTGPGSPKMRQFNRKHDIIFWYAKSDTWCFNKDDVRVPHKDGGPHSGGFVNSSGKNMDLGLAAEYGAKGKIPETWWPDFSPVGRLAKERTGYPTQKPLALLERIIKSGSNEDDVVLDPFCGCATACVAAERLGRQWIGCDLSDKAVDLIRQRLQGEEHLWRQVAKGRHIIVRKDMLVRNDVKNTLVNPKKYKETLYGKQGGYCAGCREHFQPRIMHVDHITPKARGGLDNAENLQLLCSACNVDKGDRSMDYLIAKLKKRGLLK